MAGESMGIGSTDATSAPDTPTPQTAATPAAPGVAPEKPRKPEPGESDVVKRWLRRIKAAEKHWSKPFKRMEECQQIAAYGALKDWLEDENRYVVPILNRHTNQAVAQLYARNPTAVAVKRKRMLHKVWDGTQEQIQELAARNMMGDPEAQPQLMAIAADIAQAQVQENLVERSADTLTNLYGWTLSEQPFDFKTQLKALVRRAKVNAVGYIKVNFLRENEMRPETASLMEDTQAKLRTIERLKADIKEDGSGDSDVASDEFALKSLLQDLQNHPERAVREQVIYDYPRTRDIIPDPRTRHLKSWMGTRWIAHRFDYGADQIQDIWGVDIEEMVSAEARNARQMMGENETDEPTYRLYEIQDKYAQQVCVVAEGCEQFIKAPSEPDVWVPGFFNIRALIFNEIEHDKHIFPPSDIWMARHMQFEYNRSREGLREHRIAARPYWVSKRGRLDRADKERLQNHAAHEIVEISAGDPGEKLSDVLDKGPTAPIDPNLYQVGELYSDMQRTVGTQAADLGGTSKATATEASISENGRMSSLGSNSEDLDDFLTEVASMTGDILYQEMSKERVIEIVGPGAVWPEFPATRRDLMSQVSLKTKAGASGRPNQAAKLANIERAWPALSQLPNIDPEPLARTLSDLLDIDYDELAAPGALSIIAKNAMASAQAKMGGGAPGAPPPSSGPVPQAQGPQGAANAAVHPMTSFNGQAAFPAPGAPHDYPGVPPA